MGMIRPPKFKHHILDVCTFFIWMYVSHSDHSDVHAAFECMSVILMYTLHFILMFALHVDVCNIAITSTKCVHMHYYEVPFVSKPISKSMFVNRSMFAM